MAIDPTLARTVAQFETGGELLDIGPYGSGHINDTYACTLDVGGDKERWVLQRLNHEVFRRPREVMENIGRVTDHVRRKLEQSGGDVARGTLTFVPAPDGTLLYERDDTTYWRMCRMVENAQTYDVPPGAAHVRAAARAFGEFQATLIDLPGDRLHETIPGFHHTPGRMAALENAVSADVVGRVGEAGDAISFAFGRAGAVSALTDLFDRGEIPERATHNDTKLNNVMFDRDTAEALCVIDLDTVMPGLSLYDFGDMVRAAANTGAEDDTDLSRVGVDLELFESLAAGYLGALRGVLTVAEVEHLAFSARLITLEQGIRFLADYLAGDPYYKIHREGHNLDRARAQFALVADMERNRAVMEETVREHSRVSGAA